MRHIWLGFLVACGEPSVAPAPQGAPNPDAPVAQAPGAAAAAIPERNEGTVLETMNSGGYTYAKVDACGTEVWVAGPQTTVAVGDVLRGKGNAMGGFTSSSLNRTFDVIFFLNSIDVSSTPIDCSVAANPHGAMGAPTAGSGAPHGAMPPHGNMAPAAGGPTGGDRVGTVTETMESGGYRYALVDTCGTQAWVAAPTVPVAVGEHVRVASGMTMKSFHSKTLDRTFDAIDFVTSMQTVAAAPTCE